MKSAEQFFAAALFFLTILCPIPAETFRFQAQKMVSSHASGKEKTVLEGAAEVISDTLFLKANRIELSGTDKRFIECTGHVTGADEKKGIFFSTPRLRYDRKEKIALLEGDSALEDKKNKVIAKGRYIEYNDISGTAVLQIGVRLFKDDLVCRSEWALYRREEKKLELAGLPVVFKKGDEFRANRMHVDLDTNDITMEGSVSGSLKEKKDKNRNEADKKTAGEQAETRNQTEKKAESPAVKSEAETAQ